MNVFNFFHKETGSISYVVTDSGQAAIIDPVADYQDGDIFYQHADTIINFVASHGLEVKYLLDTHVHADHLSALSYLREKVGGKTVIGEKVTKIYDYWRTKLSMGSLFSFDVLADNTTQLPLGNTTIKVIETPGHTPSCVTYHIDDTIFIGDTLFKPSSGTARVDFPGGSADTLYHSIKQLYRMPDNTEVYLCHDYPEDGNEVVISTPLSQQKEHNAMLPDSTTLEDFIRKRQARDKQLKDPKLIEVALPFNLTQSMKDTRAV